MVFISPDHTALFLGGGMWPGGPRLTSHKPTMVAVLHGPKTPKTPGLENTLPRPRLGTTSSNPLDRNLEALMGGE